MLPVAALAQTAASYPSWPVTLIVPFSPGTGIDIIARAIQPRLSQRWGQQGLIPATSTPQEMHALIKSDLARWAKVVADAGIKPD